MTLCLTARRFQISLAAFIDHWNAVLDLDREKIVQRALVPGQLDVEGLELPFELGHPLGVPGKVEADLLDHRWAIPQRRLFREVSAVAGGIEGHAHDTRQAIADEEHDVALRFVGQVAQLDPERLPLA